MKFKMKINFFFVLGKWSLFGGGRYSEGQLVKFVSVDFINMLYCTIEKSNFFIFVKVVVVGEFFVHFESDLGGRCSEVDLVLKLHGRDLGWLLAQV